MPLVATTDAGLPLFQGALAPPMTTRIPTSDGTTTGTIAEAGRLQVILVTSASSANILVLPPPIPGTIVVLISTNTTGYNLQSTAPATVGINGGLGATVKSAIPASTTCILVCETALAWKGLQMSSTAGTLAVVVAAS